jgi:hypothetical protein
VRSVEAAAEEKDPKPVMAASPAEQEAHVKRGVSRKAMLAVIGSCTTIVAQLRVSNSRHSVFKKLQEVYRKHVDAQIAVAAAAAADGDVGGEAVPEPYKASALVAESETRWDTVCEVLNSLLRNKQVIKLLYERLLANKELLSFRDAGKKAAFLDALKNFHEPEALKTIEALQRMLTAVRLANKRFQVRDGVILDAVMTVFEPLRVKLGEFRDDETVPLVVREFATRVLDGLRERLTEVIVLPDGTKFETGNMPEVFAQAVVFDPECAFKLYQQQAGWDVPGGTVNLTMKAVTEMLMAAFKENQHSDYNKAVVLGIVITEGVKQAQLKLDAAKAAVPIDNKAITAATAELEVAMALASSQVRVVVPVLA